MNHDNLKSGDSSELEALFDSIAEEKQWDKSDVSESDCQKDNITVSEKSIDVSDVVNSDDCSSNEPHDVFKRVGTLTRKLHDALRELGYDKSVEDAVGSLPDARARLEYIANLTGQAAEKVLATVEAAHKINDDLSAQAQTLNQQWQRLFNNEMSLEQFKQHAIACQDFTNHVAEQSSALGSHLTDIMMAQDFHDLTGQVVNRIATMASNLEQQLVQLLLDTTPPDQRKQVEEGWLNGPAMNAEGRTDVCSNQSQVDDLLESLGF